jgi:hypothetical protein
VKTIYLDSKYHPVTITDEAYEQIVAIVNGNQLCGACRQPYSDDHPCVSQNLCLNCFQKKYKHKGLTYVGVYTADSKGDVTHLFLDSWGYIFLTSTSSEGEPQISEFQTLMYWEFPVPKYVMRNEKQVELSTWHWRIYGDVKKNSVLYIEYDPRYGDEKPVAFLTYKRGNTEEVNRRQKRFQKLFKEARASLEATKDQRGYYHVNRHEVAGIYDAYLYEKIAEIVRAEYDQRGVAHG